MLKNNALYKSCALFALIFAFATFLFLDAKSETEKSKFESYESLRATVNGIVSSEINPEKDYLDQYFTLRKVIVAKLADNDEDKRDNIFDALGGPESALTSLGKQIADTMDGIQLMKELDHVNNSAEKFINDNIVPIFQRKGDQDKGVLMGYNEAFAELVTAYNALDKGDTLKANTALFGSATATSDKVDLYQTSLHMEVPDAGSVFLVKCNGKCYGYWEDADKMKVTCPSCGVEYYSCDKKKAHYHSKPEGSDQYNCEPKLSVSLNKTSFGTGEELVVKVKIKDLYVANMEINTKQRTLGYDNSKDPTKPSGETILRTTFTLDDIGYHLVKINVWYWKGGKGSGNGTGQLEKSYYIPVQKMGYFDNGDSFSAYSEYKAEIFEIKGMQEVRWYIKQPGDPIWRLKVHKPCGGYSSSWSYPIDSKSKTGEYKISVRVYYNPIGIEGKRYEDSFTVH